MNASLLPLGPVACPCGWSDDGFLELVDVFDEFRPPIPYDAYPPFALYGNEGAPAPCQCPDCDGELDEFTVIARNPPTGG